MEEIVMGGFGYRPPQIHLLDQQLTLDPAIVAMMRDIEIQMMARRDVDLWLRPDWVSLSPSLSQLIFAPLPSAPPSPFSFRPGAGPATPRPGDLSDVLSALWGIPIVQTQVNNLYGEARRQLGILQREWNRAPTGQRVTMVSMTGLVLGSSLTFLMMNQPTRQGVFNLLVNRDIPVPGIDGLSFKLLPRGGQITLPTPVPGLSVTGGMNFAGNPFRVEDYNINVNLDLMQFLRARHVNF